MIDQTLFSPTLNSIAKTTAPIIEHDIDPSSHSRNVELEENRPGEIFELRLKKFNLR